MKKIGLLAILIGASASSFAVSDNPNKIRTFDCMDKKTFDIKSECMANRVENSVAFKATQKAVVEDAKAVGDRAMATMTFDSRTMTIQIVAHKDATLALLKHPTIETSDDSFKE